jgi:tetratricopeptide (TPR) repeat protein
MPARPGPDRAPLPAPWRLPAAEAPPAAYAAGLSGVARLLATAQEDRELAAQLLMPALARIAAASCEPRYFRPTLVRLLALEAEAALDDPARDPRPVAELGAMLAAAVVHQGHGKARCPAAAAAAAWAWWLLGRSLLRASQRRLARSAFETVHSFIPRPAAPSEEAALAAVGLAQVAEDGGELEVAEAHLLRAADLYSQLDAVTPAASCHAQLGFLLYESGDLEGAARQLRAGLELLDPAFAPSLAARMWLALAEIETTLADSAAAAESLHRARRLYRLAPSLSEAIERTWREARIALAAGADAQAHALLDIVRRELLAHGSLAEAARGTYEQLLVEVDAGHIDAAGELVAELACAFPGAADALAAEMAGLARLAAVRPQAFYAASLELQRRLRHRAPTCPGRRPLLLPTRLLADRLLCLRSELEDPVGAADL